MSIVKKFISFVLCAILCTIMCSAVFATSTPIITISNKSDVPSNSVKIDISIANNPGIMGMTFSIMYDSENLEFVDLSRGYISAPTYNNLSDEGRIIVAVTEKEDKYDNGTLMSLIFKIKDNAKPGKYAITLANHKYEKYADSLHNCFSNSNQESIVPTVKAGSVTVEKTCENSGHKYSVWSVTKKASCTETGQKERTCARCGDIEKQEIPITHDFEAEWTVDKAATPSEDGIMSRHCKNCDAVTDKITFTYQEVEDSKDPDDNTSSDNNISSDASSNGSNSSSSVSSSDVSSSENNSSNESNSSNKTPIDNTVGAKNPLSAVENTKDFQENIKPNFENNNTSSNTENSAEQSGNSDNFDTQSITTTTDGDKDTTTDKAQPFISTSMGMAIIIICALLSIGMVVFCIILIIRRKKAEQD
ncbi:MAG: hypothetical protein IJN22_05155 [Clostridia bacterium]|nr:hypothetical protein [Clostridia bacterium]